MPYFQTHIKFVTVTMIIAALCGAWRIEQFGQIELVSDQAFFTQWVIRLAKTHHFFPIDLDGQGWFQALLHDDESFLNVFLRQIYQAQTLVFIAISALLFTLASFLVGVSMEGIVTFSVATSAIALWLVALFPVMCRRTASKDIPVMEPYAIGGLALIIGCASSFFNIFSVMGQHNSGVMFLLLAALVTQRWLNRFSETGLIFAERSTTFIMFTVQLMAIYSQYTNVFIIAPATVIAVALDPSFGPWRRFGVIARYSGITFVTFIPALALIVLFSFLSDGTTNDQTFAGIAADHIFTSGNLAEKMIFERAGLWFVKVAEIYTVPGLFLGLIGVAGMAWRDRIILPVAVVIAHFAFGSLLPPFGQYNRTAAYLLPMLMLGEGWLIVAGFRYLISQRHFGWRRTTGIGLLVVLVLTAVIRQAAIEYSRIENPSTVVHWGKLIGEAVWRPIISQIEASIPGGGTLLPWDYGLSHQFRSLSERDGQELRVLRPLETMLIHREAGTLRQYIETRGLTISEKHPIFVLAPADITPKMLNRNLQSVFDEKGFALQALPFATPRLMWKLPPAKYLKIGLRLFEIDWR